MPRWLDRVLGRRRSPRPRAAALGAAAAAPVVPLGEAEAPAVAPAVSPGAPVGEISPDRLDEALDRLRRRIPAPPEGPAG